MKKTVLKIVALLVLVLCVTLALAACGEEKDSVPASEGLSFITNGDGTCTLTGAGICMDREIVIPAKAQNGDQVTAIAEEAFKNNSLITGIVIPDSVTSIGNGAFSGCSGLTSVTIGNGITTIGEYAFEGCSGLTSVTIGDGVTSIGNSAFYQCSKLTSVYYTGDIAGWCGITFGYSTANPLYYAHNLYLNDTLLTELVIPDTVTAIKDYAFCGCSGLTSINLPGSVTSIGISAFSGCFKLESITIPFVGAAKDGGVNAHFGYIFGAQTYNDNTRAVPASLKTVTVTGGTAIGTGAFFGCSGLTSVTIGNGVTSIGSQAFSYCSGLTSINLPGSVTSIGISAFSGCSKLESITIPFVGAAKDGGVNAHFGYIFGAHTYYNDNARAVPVSLKTVTITGGTAIGTGAFNGCSKLTTVTIPDSVTSIGDRAFRDCSGLTSVTIPNSVTSIGDWAFYGCSGLTSVTIPDSVTSIGESVFFGCSGLTSILVKEGNVVFHSSGNCLIETASKTLIQGCKTSAIPIDGSVTSIGNGAFFGCSGLTSVTIGNGITTIGEYAFFGCSGLTSITIPDSVTSIGNTAFRDCSGLTSVTIPDSVTSIGDYAFHSCSGLTSINFTGTETQWNAISKGSDWNSYTGNYTIHCTDGDIAK